MPTQIVTAGTPLAGKTIVELAADGHHALALTDDGSVYSWGWNNHGQVGIGTLGPTECTPGSKPSENYCSRVIRQVVTSGTPMAGRVIRQIAAGDRWSYAVATDGTAYAWGDNRSGQLAVGSAAEYEPSPRRMLFTPKLMMY